MNPKLNLLQQNLEQASKTLSQAHYLLKQEIPEFIPRHINLEETKKGTKKWRRKE